MIQPDIAFLGTHDDASPRIDIVRGHAERDKELLPGFRQIDVLDSVFVPRISLMDDAHPDGARYFALGPQVEGIRFALSPA